MLNQSRILGWLGMSAASVLIIFASSAEAADWTIQKLSGQVWVISDRTSPAVLHKTIILTLGATLQTGPERTCFARAG